MRGIFPGEGWGQGFNNDASPLGMNPIINNNVFDSDMTDSGANASHSNSSGLTPQSTNTYRSASTTYSPPHVEDDTSGKTQFSSRAQKFSPPGQTMFPGSDVLNANAAKSPEDTTASGHDDPFKVPPGWDANNGMTPGFTGMTPDGGWEKVIQDGSWDQMMKDGNWFGQRTGMTPRNED